MSVFLLIDRKFFAAVIALMCVISTIAFPLTVSAAESNTNVYNVVYDRNNDGVINDADVELMKDVILTTSGSDFQVCDLVRVSRIAKSVSDVKTSITPELKEFVVSEMEVCEPNNWFHINFLMSDFDMVVYEDTSSFEFKFLENDILYYSINWTKGYNVVYNVDLTAEECLVSRDIADVIFKVFVKDNHYVLDVVDRPISVYHFPVNTFDVNESNNWFHINTLMNDFDKEIVEDSDGINFELKENGKTFYSIEWTKGDNIVYDEFIGSDYIVQYEDNGTWYQVFTRDNKYMLNVAKHSPNLAPALSLIDLTEGYVSDHQVQIVKDLFGSEWALVSTVSYPSYVEFHFNSTNANAEFIACIPICMDPELGKHLGTFNVITEENIDGKVYSIFDEHLGDNKNLVQLTTVR